MRFASLVCFSALLSALSLGSVGTAQQAAKAIKAVPLKAAAKKPRALPRTTVISQVPGGGARPIGSTLLVPPGGVPPGGLPAPAVAVPVSPAVTTQQHVLKISRLTFDRRPSAILRAWAAAGRPSRREGPPEPTATAERPPGPPEVRNTVTPQPAVDPFDQQLLDFQGQVTIGAWSKVRSFLAALPAEEGKALYTRLLRSLQMKPPRRPKPLSVVPRPPGTPIVSLPASAAKYSEQHVCSCDDLIALAGCAPAPLDDTLISLLGGLMRQSLTAGNALSTVLDGFRKEVEKHPPAAKLDRNQVARILFSAGRGLAAGEFLPTLEEAESQNNFAALNLLSQFHLAQYAEEKTSRQLEVAWRATQAVLAGAGETTDHRDEMEKALRRAVDVAPQVRDELGQQWLNASFTGNPSRGMDILASIGSNSAQALQRSWREPDSRVNGLRLQTTAVEALLAAAPELADRWKSSLTLLATNWLREAEISYQFDQSTSRQGQLQRDQFGNFFYRNPRQRAASRIAAIPTGDLLELRPGAHWLSLVDEALHPKFSMLSAQLLLKINEEDQAFPYVEQLASSHPKLGKTLVDEFLRVWTNNHDPNANRNQTGRYMFMYGFERKAESIPLTRSKQERNLQELSALVERLKALPVELNEELLASAFTRCHSSAEVYRLSAIENVFGKLEQLDPDTLAALAQQMRANLIGVWRQPAVQKNNKTRRTQKDIEAEVLRGYQVARAVVDDAFDKHPTSWALQLARASLSHDENTYRKELKPDSTFSQRRDDAFAGFKKAAALYSAALPSLSQEEETSKVYEIWFYASLGACDLNQITERQTADLRQAKRIRAAILTLEDEETSKRHLALFANTLFTRMSAAKPAIKFRYVRTGLEIVGEHKQASEARKVYDYYNDLVTEIKLETSLDGNDVVGHTEPFGVFVQLRHTREIERESGGFGRYLQNQQNGNAFYYNYGRPIANYRDKFEETVRQSLDEQFEILSVTFQHEDVNSRALADAYGWRMTPYAYLLLQARGPEVDTLPGLQLNLDFLDTSGYVIIPVESAAVPLDASAQRGAARPLEKLSVTQTLDERQADEGKLILEVKAIGRGLLPPLDDLVDLAPPGFEIVSSRDRGLSVSEFDPDAREPVMICERNWTVTLASARSQQDRPKTFAFASSKMAETEMLFQRFADADLVEVDRIVDLEEAYGQASYAWLGRGGVAVMLVLIAGAVILMVANRGRKHAPAEAFAMPDDVNAFTVLGLLKQIRAHHGVDQEGRQELAQAIAHLEVEFFSNRGSHPSDLETLARTWIQRTA